MREGGAPLRFRGIEGVFLGLLALTAIAAFGLAVHRHIVEERTRGVSLMARVDDVLALLAESGVPFERGFDALLEAGVDSLALRGASIDALERRGALTAVSSRELDRLSRLSRAFPEILLNAPAHPAEIAPNGLALLSADLDLLKRIELAVTVSEARRGARIADCPGAGGTLSVLLIPNAGEALRREELVEDAELADLLRKMGFRLYQDLGGTPPLEVRAGLAGALERGRLAGVLVRRERGKVGDGPAAGILADLAARPGGLRGTVVAVDGRPPRSSLSLDPWSRLLSGSLVPAREMRSFDEPVAAFLARGAARALILPTRGMPFGRFRESAVAFRASLRGAGVNLGERRGTTPVGPEPGAFVASLFLLTLACLSVSRLALAPPPLALALHVTLLVALIPLIPFVAPSGTLVPAKFALGCLLAALFGGIPFLVERLHRVAAKEAARPLPVALFQAVATAVWFVVLSPLLEALFYDPFHLALPPTSGFRTAALLLVALAVLVAPALAGRFRHRLAGRLLDRPLAARDLLAGAALLGLLAAVVALGARGLAAGPASWWRGAGEALVGVPLLVLYFHARLRLRLRTSWLLAPFAAAATAGPAFDLVFDPAAPVLLSFTASTRTFAAGLVLAALAAAFVARLDRRAREEAAA